MLKSFLSSNWCIVVAALLAVLLSAPSLSTGLVMDDYWHWEILSGHVDNSHSGSPFGLFTFADGDPARTHELMDKGLFPWWTADTLRLSFWRPLAELTHWLDYYLWPESPSLMHAQNIFWYGLLVVLLGVWFRAIDSNKIRGGIAVLIYAASGLHGPAIGWIANRNSLIAAALSVATLIAFHRWRSAGSIKHAGVACIAFALSLLAGESALATAAYLFAYVLTLDKAETMVRRLMPLLPFFIIAVIWKLVYSHFGYGSEASGVYIDPGSEMARFIPAAAARLPVLLFAQLFGVPSALFGVVPQQMLYVALALLFLGAFFYVLYLLRLLSNALARFYIIGMVLALVPVCATNPDDRLLVFAGFGACGLLSLFFFQIFSDFRGYTGNNKLLVKGCAVLLGLVHLVALPILLPANVGSLSRFAAPLSEDPALQFPKEITAQTRIVLVNPPIASFVAYMPFIRHWHGLIVPRSISALSPGTSAMTLSRIDDSTIQLSVHDGFIAPYDNFFRAARFPFKPGEIIDVNDMVAHVISVMPDGRPHTVRFRFDGGLYNSNLQFYVWDKTSYRALDFPEVGRSIELAPCDLGEVVAGKS